MWRSILLLVLPVALLASCSDDFAPYSRLDRLRVLGVSSRPANPMPGETATLDALVFAPSGESVSYRWSWCPVAARAADNFACPLDEAGFAQVLGAALPPFDLGSSNTASFTNPFSAATLAAACGSGVSGAGFSDSVDCDDGYPITAVLDVSAAGESLRAGFVVRLPAASSPELNRNPGLDGLLGDGVELAGTPATSLAVAPGRPIDLLVRPAAEASESRPVPPAEGRSGRRPERLTLSWFADAGELDKERTAFIDGVASMDEASRNRWTAPRADEWPAGPVSFHVVVRDDRGGVGWLSRQVKLEVRP